MPDNPTLRVYSADISWARHLRTELRITGEIRRSDMDRLRLQIERVMEMLKDAFID